MHFYTAKHIQIVTTRMTTLQWYVNLKWIVEIQVGQEKIQMFIRQTPR